MNILLFLDNEDDHSKAGSDPKVRKRHSKRQKKVDKSNEDPDLVLMLALEAEMNQEMNELTSHISRMQTIIADEELDLEKLVSL